MLKLVAFAKKRASDITELLANEDRKKSHNMTYATAVAQDVLSQVDSSLRDHLDIIFCTGEGEIAQTFEFYKNLSNNERARPLVFQNSLHNSTLGALSLSIPNVSSGITVSNGDISFEMGISLALASNSSRPILVIGTDVYIDKVIELRSEFYGKNVKIESGSCAGLFIPESHPLFKTFNAPIISNIEIETGPTLKEEDFLSYYPSNGIEAIFEGLKTSSSFTLSRPSNYKIHVNS